MNENETPKPVPIRLGDLLREWELDAAHAHGCYTTGQARGPVTGLPRLDETLGGFLAPGVHVIHGGSGSGKTALALQVASTCGCPAVYVTCEMSPLVLLRRITARVTGTNIRKFRTGELAPAASLELVNRAVAACPDLWILDATAAYPWRADIEATARHARGDGRDVLLVVDSVHAWAHGAETGDAREYESLNAHLLALNSLAIALKAPVLAIAERRRSATDGGQDASAGTRRFEYGAETVLEVDRDKNGTPAGENLALRELPVTLTFSKNRNGEDDRKIPAFFNRATLAFREDC